MKKLQFVILLVFVTNILNGQGNQGNFNLLNFGWCPSSYMNCSAIPNQNCNIINNNILYSDYNPMDMCQWANPFGQGLVEGWASSHGMPYFVDAYPPYTLPPVSGSNFVELYANASTNPAFSTGVVTKFKKLQAGNKYLLSFYKQFEKHGDPNTTLTVDELDDFTIALIKCSDYLNFNINSNELPPVPNGAQIIYCEKGMSNLDWEQVYIEFTAESDFDMMWVYVEQTNHNDPNKFDLCGAFFAYPELIDITNFSVGPSPTNVPGVCDVTIGPNPENCSVKNAVFTWTDHNGNIIYQGPDQSIDINLGNGGGYYTLSMTIPTATITTNSCSENSPVVSAQVYVPYQCDCGSIQIQSPTVTYRHVSTTGTVTPSFLQNLDVCINNVLCFDYGEEDGMTINGNSSLSSGNIWEARVLSVADNNNHMFRFNGVDAPIPYGSNYLTVGNGQNLNLQVFHTAMSVSYVIEVRLRNVNVFGQKILTIKSVIRNAPFQNGFYCINSSPGFPFPHKVILGGAGLPGFSYNWTFPAGMNILTPLNQPTIEWDDSGFDYNSNPNPTASVNVTNTHGCPTYSDIVQISPSYCTQGRIITSMDKLNSEKHLEKKVLSVFPNPFTDILKIRSEKIVKSIELYSITGLFIETFIVFNKNQDFDFSKIKNGTYLLKMIFEDKSFETKLIYKLR